MRVQFRLPRVSYLNRDAIKWNPFGEVQFRLPRHFVDPLGGMQFRLPRGMQFRLPRGMQFRPLWSTTIHWSRPIRMTRPARSFAVQCAMSRNRCLIKRSTGIPRSGVWLVEKARQKHCWVDRCLLLPLFHLPIWMCRLPCHTVDPLGGMQIRLPRVSYLNRDATQIRLPCGMQIRPPRHMVDPLGKMQISPRSSMNSRRQIPEALVAWLFLGISTTIMVGSPVPLDNYRVGEVL